jgi:hypothetical protein
MFAAPYLLLKCHNDAVIRICHRAPSLDGGARKLSAERTGGHGGVGRARLRRMLEVDGYGALVQK